MHHNSTVTIFHSQEWKTNQRQKEEDYTCDFETVDLEKKNWYSQCHKSETKQVIVGTYPFREIFFCRVLGPPISCDSCCQWVILSQAHTLLHITSSFLCFLVWFGLILLCFASLFSFVKVNKMWTNSDSGKLHRFIVVLERRIRQLGKRNAEHYENRCQAIWNFRCSVILVFSL